MPYVVNRFAICAVDDVPSEVFDKLLYARDGEWRSARSAAGKSTDNKDGYSDGELLTPKTDTEWLCPMFVARSLKPDVSDDVATAVPPIATFKSPFIAMSPEEIADALQEKHNFAEEVYDSLFAITDARSADDDTVWMCQRQDKDSDGREQRIVRKVRTRFPILVLSLLNLEIANTDMDEYEAVAAKTGGILEDDQNE